MLFTFILPATRVKQHSYFILTKNSIKIVQVKYNVKLITGNKILNRVTLGKLPNL